MVTVAYCIIIKAVQYIAHIVNIKDRIQMIYKLNSPHAPSYPHFRANMYIFKELHLKMHSFIFVNAGFIQYSGVMIASCKKIS